jgi:hypothetical protein
MSGAEVVEGAAAELDVDEAEEDVAVPVMLRLHEGVFDVAPLADAGEAVLVVDEAGEGVDEDGDAEAVGAEEAGEAVAAAEESVKLRGSVLDA